MSRATAILLLAAALTLAAIPRAGAPAAAAAPAQAPTPTPTPTTVPGPGLCTVEASQTAAASRVERGLPLELTVVLRAECPTQAEGSSDIMLAVDVSGSMAQDGKHEASVRAVESFVDHVDFSRHRVGLVLFSDRALIAQTLTSQPSRILSAFDQLGEPGGGTDIAAAVIAADGELASRGRPTAAQIIVLLTDGISPAEPAFAAARAARDRGTFVFSIGLGQDVAADVLRGVASTAEHYYFSPDAAGLAVIYDRIAALIRRFVVTDVWLYDRPDPSAAYVAGSSRPLEPVPVGGALGWRRSFVLEAPSTIAYSTRLSRLGTVTPSSELWVEYLDGDGMRHRLDVTPVSVEVFEPIIRHVYLPMALKHECEKVTARADVVLVVDISSSMTGDKFEQARAAARTFVSLLELPGDQAAVVGYSQHARLLQGLTGNRAALDRALDTLAVDSGTRIDRGLEAAVGELEGPRRVEANRPVIVLLTDGIQVEEPGSPLTWADYASAIGVTIYTVALGADADRTLLRRIAGQPSRAYYAPAPEDLGRIYRDVAGAVRCR